MNDWISVILVDQHEQHEVHMGVMKNMRKTLNELND